MSQQGPILVVSTMEREPFAAALDDAKIFPIIDTTWADASRAVDELQPAAVLVAMSGTAQPSLESLAKQIAARQPYLPLIAIDPGMSLPENAIPFSQVGGNFDRLMARLRAALRVRTLHATVMRRLDDDPAQRKQLSDTDPIRDATVLLIGRGEQPIEWMAELLAGRDRHVAGPTAPASGLTFLGPRYEAHWGLPTEVCQIKAGLNEAGQ